MGQTVQVPDQGTGWRGPDGAVFPVGDPRDRVEGGVALEGLHQFQHRVLTFTHHHHVGGRGLLQHRGGDRRGMGPSHDDGRGGHFPDPLGNADRYGVVRREARKPQHAGLPVGDPLDQFRFGDTCGLGVDQFHLVARFPEDGSDGAQAKGEVVPDPGAVGSVQLLVGGVDQGDLQTVHPLRTWMALYGNPTGRRLASLRHGSKFSFGIVTRPPSFGSEPCRAVAPTFGGRGALDSLQSGFRPAPRRRPDDQRSNDRRSTP